MTHPDALPRAEHLVLPLRLLVDLLHLLLPGPAYQGLVPLPDVPVLLLDLFPPLLLGPFLLLLPLLPLLLEPLLVLRDEGLLVAAVATARAATDLIFLKLSKTIYH